jgi:hypothetical protein
MTAWINSEWFWNRFLTKSNTWTWLTTYTKETKLPRIPDSFPKHIRLQTNHSAVFSIKPRQAHFWSYEQLYIYTQTLPSQHPSKPLKGRLVRSVEYKKKHLSCYPFVSALGHRYAVHQSNWCGARQADVTCVEAIGLFMLASFMLHSMFARLVNLKYSML